MILIDYRKGSKELAPYIHNNHEIATLDYGDVSFVGMGDNEPAFVCVERKVIGDLVQSMSSGRLSGHQLVGMLEKYTHIYLLVEGIWRPNPKTGIVETLHGKKWKSIWPGARIKARNIYNFINNLMLRCGVYLLPFTDNVQQSSYLIDSLYDSWQIPWKDHRSHLKFHRQDVKPKTKKAILLRPPTSFERIVSGISGVGFSRATLLEKHFRTPLELSLASEKQLTDIKGIGRQVARLIIKELRNNNG